MASVAVVVGASIGGLLSGLVLAEVCDKVVLVERGELSDTPAHRAGVPQGMHAHGLLAGGLAALEQLLPGLCRELEQRGCPTGDNLRDTAWVFSGRRLALGDSGVRGMTVARPLLEHAIRRRVAELPNLSIRTNLRVTGLLYGAGRVKGVRLVPALGGAAEELTADLPRPTDRYRPSQNSGDFSSKWWLVGALKRRSRSATSRRRSGPREFHGDPAKSGAH